MLYIDDTRMLYTCCISRFVHLAVGDEHCAAVTSMGNVYTWGQVNLDLDPSSVTSGQNINLDLNP